MIIFFLVVEVGVRDVFFFFRWFNIREDRLGLVVVVDFFLFEVKFFIVRGIRGIGVLSSLEFGFGRVVALDVYKIFIFLLRRKYLIKKIKKIYKCVDFYLYVY